MCRACPLIDSGPRRLDLSVVRRARHPIWSGSSAGEFTVSLSEDISGRSRQLRCAGLDAFLVAGAKLHRGDIDPGHAAKAVELREDFQGSTRGLDLVLSISGGAALSLLRGGLAVGAALRLPPFITREMESVTDEYALRPLRDLRHGVVTSLIAWRSRYRRDSEIASSHRYVPAMLKRPDRRPR